MSDKLVMVSDFDRTFYINDEDIEINKKYVEKFREKGNLFIIATGRSYQDFIEKVDKYKFQYDYVILNHGATILDNNDNILINNYIDDEIILKIKNDLKLDESLFYFCCKKLESRIDISNNQLTKINIKYNSNYYASSVYERIRSKYFNDINIYHINPDTIEIVSINSKKINGINFLINKLNLKKDHIYTIGDGCSDVEMIINYNGYAMNNSTDEVLKNANKIVSSVSELIKKLI